MAGLGMDEERNEHMVLWKWDTRSNEGFQTVSYRGPMPQIFTAGCYAVVYNGELWVFPGPRNHNMRNVYCCDLQRYRWVERATLGEPPCETQMRRNISCFVYGKVLLVTGGTYMDRIYQFDFEARQWTKHKTKSPNELKSTWNFGGACLWKDSLYSYGSSRRISEEPSVEVWPRWCDPYLSVSAQIYRLDLNDWKWHDVKIEGNAPPYRIHASSAVVGSKWIIHGGRRPNMSKFNVSDQTFIFDLEEHRWSILMAEGEPPAAREWHTAIGIGDRMIVVGGRVDIPDYEPIPLSFDTMCTDVEILEYRKPPESRSPTGKANILAIYRKLYNSPYLSDVTLIVEDKKFPAHCHVLATHSSVFERMWESTMQEMETREVRIEDVSQDTMILFLQYMYGVLETVPDNHQVVIDLFKAADKYNVKGLVQECVVMFEKLTDEDTLAPLLEVAEERNNDELRRVCEQIALKRLSKILLTEAFMSLTQRNPHLTLPFIHQVLQRLLPENPDEFYRYQALTQENPSLEASTSRGWGRSFIR